MNKEFEFSDEFVVCCLQDFPLDSLDSVKDQINSTINGLTFVSNSTKTDMNNIITGGADNLDPVSLMADVSAVYKKVF